MFIREDRNEIAVIRLAYGKVSAMDARFCAALAKEIANLRKAPLRAAVIIGTGKTFSAGVDLKQFLGYDETQAREFFKTLDDLWLACLTSPKPIVAAVNGHALAGGCILAAACDYRVTSDDAGHIGVPELAVGVPFPALPWEITAARVAASAHRQLVFLGRTFTAAEAVAAGLTEETCAPERLLDRGLEVAARLAAIPAASFQLAKEMHNRPILERANASADLDARALSAWLSDEVRASISRYLEALTRRAGP